MIYFKKNIENGQSLVEFIILVPIFFLVLCGINLYLNQQIKSLTEDSAYDGLLISDSHFDSEERALAMWNAASLKTFQYNNNILNNSFNSSEHFNKSIDQKDGVFFDKKKVAASGKNTCTKNPFYQLEESKFGEFKFNSCADGDGFERAKFSYQNILEDFKIAHRFFEGKSIYFPNKNFSWENRHLIGVNAVKNFKTSLEEQGFKSLYASLAIPKDHAQFNSNCLMNPQASNASNCTIPSLTGKWRRAAFDGANTQVLECFTEASLKCLKTMAPPAIAACIVERTAEIAAALSSGQKSYVCPILNKMTEVLYNKVILKSKIYETKNLIDETKQRIDNFL